jgi:hypothetical protein
MFRQLRSWKKVLGQLTVRRTAIGRQPKPRRRLLVELLEDRTLPTTTNVWIASVANALESVSAGYFCLQRDQTAAALTVNYQIDSSSTAVNGDDFPYLSGTTSQDPMNGSVSFAVGQATLDIVVDPIGNYSHHLGGNKTVEIDLQSSGGGGCGCCGSGSYNLGSPSGATLTIVDNPTVWIASVVNAQEGVSAGYFCLQRDQTITAVTVNYQIDSSGTTAINGIDFPYLPGTSSSSSAGSVTFAAGQATLEIVVNPTGIYTHHLGGNKTVEIDLQNTGCGYCGLGGTGNYGLGSPSSDTLTIADEPSTPPPANPPNPGCPTCGGQLASLFQGAPAASGNLPSNVSPAGVRYSDGTLQFSTTDLSSNGSGDPWSQTRSWTNGPGYALGSDNGNGWVDSDVPMLKYQWRRQHPRVGEQWHDRQYLQPGQWQLSGKFLRPGPADLRQHHWPLCADRCPG